MPFVHACTYVRTYIHVWLSKIPTIPDTDHTLSVVNFDPRHGPGIRCQDELILVRAKVGMVHMPTCRGGEKTSLTRIGTQSGHTMQPGWDVMDTQMGRAEWEWGFHGMGM